jgi:hypothetical protein
MAKIAFRQFLDQGCNAVISRRRKHRCFGDEIAPRDHRVQEVFVAGTIRTPSLVTAVQRRWAWRNASTLSRNSASSSGVCNSRTAPTTDISSMVSTKPGHPRRRNGRSTQLKGSPEQLATLVFPRVFQPREHRRT